MPLATVAALTAAVSFVAAAPVQTYTAEPNPSRSEGLRTTREFLPGADPDNGLLLTPTPFPDNRTDSVDRPENGRLWVPRTPVGNRTPIRELPRGFPGPASFGAPADLLDEVIFVKPRVGRSPVVAISPWDEVSSSITDQLEDQRPYLGRVRTNLRSAAILRDLQEAQNQWLEERGYILNVRTHKHPGVIQSQGERAQRPEEIEPRAVIRVHPPEPGADEARKQAAAPVAPRATVIVVRSANDAAATE